MDSKQALYPHLLEINEPKWLRTVLTLCEQNDIILSPLQTEELAAVAGTVEQLYFNICTYAPLSEEIELTVENFIITCLPAKRDGAL